MLSLFINYTLLRSPPWTRVLAPAALQPTSNPEETRGETKAPKQQRQQNSDHADEATTQDTKNGWRRASGHGEEKHRCAYSKATTRTTAT